jgi:hypothetical protein
MSVDGKLGRISNYPKRKFFIYAMKTILAISVEFLLLCICDSLMERNSTASREYYDG